MGFGFGLMEALFPILFLVFFAFFICTLVSNVARSAKERRRNDASPRLTVPASVVAKRAQVGSTRHHNSATHTSHTSYHTSYYVTFEFESGDRLELPMAPADYGMLVEGDHGLLSFQGTRYLGFQRT